MIRGGNATVFVSDMDRAVEFYTRTLALKLVFRAGNHWASIDAGDGFQIGLHPRPAGAGPASSPAPSTATEVGLGLTQPIDQAVRELERRGVEFRGPIKDDGSVRLAHFSDPDGNPLYLVEVKY